MMIAALTAGGQQPTRLAVCDDTSAMALGLATREGTVDIGRAGAAMRFLTAFYAVTPGTDVLLTGDDRMQHRPIGQLVDALLHLGADISYAGQEGYPPIRVKGRELAGGSLSLPTHTSSQFASALLLTAPAMSGGLTLNLGDEEPVSRSYIDMTIAMMKQAGINVARSDNEIKVAPGSYSNAQLPAETDWTAASYWFEVEALSSGFITLEPPLDSQSIQGDRAAARLFAELGARIEYEGEEPDTSDLLATPDISPRLVADLTNNPDLAITLVVTCVLLRVPFRLSGLRSLRFKEADRIEALQKELLKIGATVDYGQDGPDTLSWEGQIMPVREMPRFDSHGDHRMAMAFAPVALYIPGIIVDDVEVVAKSYPQYWEQLRRAGFRLYDASLPVDEILRLEAAAQADSE